MQKTAIEWTDYTSNPVKGLCPVACTYCYARAIYRRFKWDPTIRWDGGEAQSLLGAKDGSKVFVGSMIDLFHPVIKSEWLETIFGYVLSRPKATFQFLTKCPQRLKEFSPFPDNAWVGVSATNGRMLDIAGYHLSEIEAKVRFVSLEPLLEQVHIYFGRPGLSWLILGAQTKPTVLPKREWVEEIEAAANQAGIPVFEKDSLAPLFPVARALRREWPK